MDQYNTPEVELDGLAEDYMMKFGVNINLQRSVPDLRDGLKPVARRIMYIAYKNYKMNIFKVSTALGLVLTIHPHGDQGLADVFARLAQTFSNNMPLLSSSETGNSGNATSGNDNAAARYLDLRMSKFAMNVLFDEFDNIVNMKPGYDTNHNEPIVLPAKFPIVLLNGTAGIGYTLSTDIPPYNLNEIADAVIKLLKNPNANIRLVPDSPTGCDIIVKDEESFIMQSSFEIDAENYIITIRNTPYMRYLNDIDKALRELQASDSSQRIDEILSADNESNLRKGEIRYVIRCKKKVNLYNVINKLFKRVPGFKITISSHNLKVVDNFKTCCYSIPQVLKSWIKYRLEFKRSYFLRKLVSKTTQHNMLDGKKYMLAPENIEKTIKIFRSCNSRADIIPSLVKAYGGRITTSQANYISELRMYNLTHDEYVKTVTDMEKLEEEIVYINDTVRDPEKIKMVIIDEIKEIKNTYNSPRKSKIINKNIDSNIGVVQILPSGSVIFSETENPEMVSSDITFISDDNVCLIDTTAQFTWVDVNKVVHDQPMTLSSIGKTEMGSCVYVTSNPNNDIVILTNKGRVKYMPISKIPSTNTTRKPLIPICDTDEEVVSIIELRPDANDDLFVYTKDGYGKRISISTLNKVLSVDAVGQFILTGYNVSGMFVLRSDKPLLMYATRLGKLRINQSKYLTTVAKFSEPKSIIKLSPQDDLVAVFCVDKNEAITLNHADGRVTTVNVDSLPISTMAVEPVRPKHVPGVKVIRATLSNK